MAVVAARTEPLFVAVVGGMAGQTVVFCILECQRLVALFAFGVSVTAAQWKARPGVIKTRFAPTAFVMAVATLNAQLPAVPLLAIVAFVAAVAERRRLFAEAAVLVAAIAFRCPVFAAQGKMRITVVIEIGRFPAALVMAAFALFAQ